MADMPVTNVNVNRIAKRTYRLGGEWLRLCTIYLGITVIVTVDVSLTLPNFHTQDLQVHRSILDSLSSPIQSGQNSVFFLAQETDGDAVAPATTLPAGSNAAIFLQLLHVISQKVGTEHSCDEKATVTKVEVWRNYISRKYKVANDATVY